MSTKADSWPCLQMETKRERLPRVTVSPNGDSLTVSPNGDVLAVEKKLGEVSALAPEGFHRGGWGEYGPVVIVVGREGFTHRRQTVRQALGSTSRLPPSKLIWHVSGTKWPLTYETPAIAGVLAPLVSVCKSDCSAFGGSNPSLATNVMSQDIVDT